MSKNEATKKSLWSEIVKYSATGLLGASVAFATSWYHRLPSHALTVLPAGVHVMEGPSLSCAEKTFLTGDVNEYLDTPIMTPPCDVLLSHSQVTDLLADLARVKDVYRQEREAPMKAALDGLLAIEAKPPKGDAAIRKATIEAIANLVYIRNHVPEGVSGTELLPLMKKEVTRVLTDVQSEMSRMDQIRDEMNQKTAGKTLKHIEFYFVVTNSSDVEFYFPRTCTLSTDSDTWPVVLEKLEGDGIPIEALTYVPMLPGRGRVFKYSVEKSKAAEADKLTQGEVKDASLSCTLNDNTVVNSSHFSFDRFRTRDTGFQGASN